MDLAIFLFRAEAVFELQAEVQLYESQSTNLTPTPSFHLIHFGVCPGTMDILSC
jgi:hypothetical protein